MGLINFMPQTHRTRVHRHLCTLLVLTECDCFVHVGPKESHVVSGVRLGSAKRCLCENTPTETPNIVNLAFFQHFSELKVSAVAEVVPDI